MATTAINAMISMSVKPIMILKNGKISETDRGKAMA